MTAPLLVANWKMNLPPEGVGAYCNALIGPEMEGLRLLLAPPFPWISEVARALKGSAVWTAAQDCSDARSGAYTGEVSAEMIAACGGRAVILGHSERRERWGEETPLVAGKLERAREAGLVPIFCVGEPLLVREQEETELFLAGQLALPEGTLRGMSEVVVAYEPVWAIGTGRNASAGQVEETTRFIRETVRQMADPGSTVSILYGGSVTPGNVEELAASEGVNGFLVGGASLDSSMLIDIGRSLRQRSDRAGSGPRPREESSSKP